MSKKFQLSIPTPCHENWDNMTPVEKGRFCGSCQKQVVDFSRLSDREIAMFFKKPSAGSVCGRFMEDQLDRDIEIPKKRIPWIKYFFQFALPAFLISAKASAQGKVKIKKESNQYEQMTCTRTLGLVAPAIIEKKQTIGDTIYLNPEKEIDQRIIIGGRVIDEMKDPVAFASVIIKGTIYGTKTNGDGYFEIEPPKELDKLTIVVKAQGFNESELLVDVQKFTKDTTAIIKMEFKVIVEVETTVTGMIARKPVKPLPLLPMILKDTATKFFKIFPNPTKSGATINIEWKQSETGEYIFQIFNQAGQLTFNKEMWIDDEARVLNLEVPHVAAGNYFLRMTNKNSGKAFTEKIIIQ